MHPHMRHVIAIIGSRILEHSSNFPLNMHCGSIVAHIGSMYMYMYSAAEKAELYIATSH